MPRSDVFGPALVLVSVMLTSPALAGAPSELSIDASGQCPKAEQVQQQLKPLLVETRIYVGSARASEVAWISDEGQGFRVKVRDVERVIANPARDCKERARIAAVLVALVVDPPLPAAPNVAASPPAQKPEASASTPSLPPPSELRWALMAGGSAAVAMGAEGDHTWGAGPALRALVGEPGWEVSLTAGFLSPVLLDLESGGVRATRAPLDLSASLLFGSANVRGVAGAGVAGALVHFTGTGLSQARSTLRFDLGLHTHAGFRFRFGPELWGLAEVSATYFPRPYEFEVPPNGVVGRTPAFWLATTLGVSVAFR